ncbi:hypothetical protein FGIG_05762 [Fasciola gigantica]|uniref:Uncharacterized protein n=1 Tax=Fasciola gigantica TaxID=46835 RepID=A0A504YFM1_FASGI|nr:hypothetical protein FGIG_05762 [Fasciola gigantica]
MHKAGDVRLDSGTILDTDQFLYDFQSQEQDRMPLGPDTAKYKNKLNQPTTDMMHVAVLLLLSTSCLLHLYIRWSMNGMDLYAGEARKSGSRGAQFYRLHLGNEINNSIAFTLNANRLKSFFDVNIQEQLLLITEISIQLRVIKIPHEYNCPLLGSISHVVKLQIGLLNLLSSVVVFSAAKIHNLNILMIKIYASCYLILSCLAATFYFTIPKHYYTMNCLPRIIVPSLVYPMLITHSVAGVFLILYWTRPPYRNLDEWIGICGNTAFSLALWSTLVKMRKPNTFVSRGVIRLTMLTLVKVSMVIWDIAKDDVSFVRNPIDCQ